MDREKHYEKYGDVEEDSKETTKKESEIDRIIRETKKEEKETEIKMQNQALFDQSAIEIRWKKNAHTETSLTHTFGKFGLIDKVVFIKDRVARVVFRYRDSALKAQIYALENGFKKVKIVSANESLEMTKKSQ